jgi:hypothetical protein
LRIKALVVVLAALTPVLAVPAVASPLSEIFNLTADHCTGTCGTSPFGTVKLEEVFGDPDSVDVTVTLSSALKLIHTGGPHQTFAFNLSDGTSTPPTVQISNLTAKFIVANGTFVVDHYVVDYSVAGTKDKNVGNFGNFAYLIDWTGGSGGGHGSPGPLSFRVTAGHKLTLDDFIDALNDSKCTGTGASKICKPVGNPTDYKFAADVIGNNGKTGEVAALPEPATLVLFSAGLLGLGASRRRRRKV